MVNAKQHNSTNKQKNIISLIIMLLIVIIINYVGSLLFKRFDLTTEKRYTLASTTKDLLKEVNDEVYLKVYLQGNFNPSFTRLRNEAKELLDEFRAYSNNQIQYEFIVPGEGLNETEKGNLEKQLYEKGLLPEQVVENKNDKKLETLIWPGAIVTYKGRETVWQIFKRQVGIAPEECINNSVQELEYSLSNSIRKLQRIKDKQVTFIEGHGELDTLQNYDLARALAEYYEVNRTPILGKLATLNESSCIIIAQPDSAFTDKDKFIIDQYIMNGGKALWLVDPVNVDRDTLNLKGYSIGLNKNLRIDDMLFKYGVRLNNVLVQDLQCATIPINVGFKNGQPNFKPFPWVYNPLILPDNAHPIVKNLDLIRMDYCSTIDTIKTNGIKKTILLKTSKYSKTQPTPARLFLASVQYKPKPKQYNTPYLPVAVLLEGSFNSFVEYRLPTSLLADSNFKYTDKGKPTKQIIVANGDIARNDVSKSTGQLFPLGYDKFNRQTFANKTFLVNCVNYLLDDEGMLQLRTREVKLRLLDKKKVDEQRGYWQRLNVLAPLFLLTIVGICQFYLRKRKFAK
jgi:ABC-2 type transport system permease protein